MSDHPYGDGQPSDNPEPGPPSPPPQGYGPPPQGYGPPPPYALPYGYAPPARGGYPGAAPNAYAHWGTRLGAYTIDVFVPLILLSVVERMLALVAVTEVIVALLYLALLGFQIWNLFLRQGRTGQTLGKELFGIILIDEQTGRPLGGGMTFVRYLAKIIDSLICYVGWLFPLWDAKRQTVSDKIMHTVVVPGGDPTKKKF